MDSKEILEKVEEENVHFLRRTWAGFLERVSWRLARAGELAEGRLALRRRDRTRYALLVLWCAVLAVWLITLRVYASLTALLKLRLHRRSPSSRSSTDRSGAVQISPRNPSHPCP